MPLLSPIPAVADLKCDQMLRFHEGLVATIRCNEANARRRITSTLIDPDVTCGMAEQLIKQLIEQGYTVVADTSGGFVITW